jgi:hypothetical protein
LFFIVLNDPTEKSLLAKAIADANAAKADAEATKASIIAKQEAFIKGL